MKSLRLDARGLLFILIWTSGYLGGAIVAPEMSPLATNLWRFLGAAVVLGALALRRRERWPRTPRAIAAAALLGFLVFAVQFGGLYTGMAEGVSASTTALIACSTPLLVAVIGTALGWDRLRPIQWLGIGIGVLGVVVTLSDRVGRPPSTTALAWTLLGLVGLTAGTALQGRLGDIGDPFASAGPVLLFALIRERGATTASSLLFVVPAVTALGAWPLLGAAVGPTAITGLGIAGVGLYLARRPPRRPYAAASPPAPAVRPSTTDGPTPDDLIPARR